MRVLWSWAAYWLPSLPFLGDFIRFQCRIHGPGVHLLWFHRLWMTWWTVVAGCGLCWVEFSKVWVDCYGKNWWDFVGWYSFLLWKELVLRHAVLSHTEPGLRNHNAATRLEDERNEKKRKSVSWQQNMSYTIIVLNFNRIPRRIQPFQYPHTYMPCDRLF